MTQTPHTRGRLLVVEDEALVAMLIEEMVTDAGFEVVGPFGQAQAALARLQASEPIDGALLDVNLGGGERSYAVANALAARGVPYVFVTGYGQAGIDARYAEVPVLQKPFTPETLEKMLRLMFADRP